MRTGTCAMREVTLVRGRIDTAFRSRWLSLWLPPTLAEGERKKAATGAIAVYRRA